MAPLLAARPTTYTSTRRALRASARRGCLESRRVRRRRSISDVGSIANRARKDLRAGSRRADARRERRFAPTRLCSACVARAWQVRRRTALGRIAAPVHAGSDLHSFDLAARRCGRLSAKRARTSLRFAAHFGGGHARRPRVRPCDLRRFQHVGGHARHAWARAWATRSFRICGLEDATVPVPRCAGRRVRWGRADDVGTSVGCDRPSVRGCRARGRAARAGGADPGGTKRANPEEGKA
jgi:hypothetical protein